MLLNFSDLVRNGASVLGKFRNDDLYGLQIVDRIQDDPLLADDSSGERLLSDALLYASRLRSLRVIEIDKCRLSKSALHDLHIDDLDNLEGLMFNNCATDGEWIAAAASSTLPRLLNFEINGVRHLEPILAKMKSSLRIQHLRVAGMEASFVAPGASLTNSDLSTYISKMETLSSLELDNNHKINDDGLVALLKLKKLKSLQLAGCNITPAAIDTLSKLKLLSTLTISVDRRWKRADVDRLKAALPKKCEFVPKR